jgi:protein TonB
MKKERKADSFLQTPVYPGGDKAMRDFVSRHIQYPEVARLEKIEGTVRLRLDINHQGIVTAAKIVSSVGYGCDEEAQRVVKLLHFEVSRSRRVRSILHKTINIHFKLNAQPVAEAPSPTPPPVTTPSSPAIQYSVTPTVSSSDKKDKGGFEYSVTL